MTSDDAMTCGKGLAEHAALPARLGDLSTAMAAVLQTHLDALDLNDSRSKPEQAAYSTLTNDFRAVASSLQMIAARMAGYRDLPMAAHDEARLSSAEARNTFAAFVDSERALLELLTRYTTP